MPRPLRWRDGNICPRSLDRRKCSLRRRRGATVQDRRREPWGHLRPRLRSGGVRPGACRTRHDLRFHQISGKAGRVRSVRHLRRRRWRGRPLGLYLQNIGAHQKHDFVRPDGTRWPAGDQVRVSPGHWQWVQQQAGFRAKKTADRPSYAWDQLIELFVEHVIAGTTEGIGGAEVDVSNAEQALRLMAQEDRINRRMLGEAFLESIQIVISRRATQFARRVIAGPTAINRTLGYIILILAQPRRGTAWGLRPIPPGPCADPASLLLRVDGGGAGAGERGRSCARCASLKSGISLPINHISSTLQPASRSSFRLEVS